MSKRRAKLTVFLSKNIMRLMLRQAFFFFFFLIVVAGSRNEKSVTSANKAVCMWQPMHTGQEVSAKNFIQPFCLMCTCEVGVLTWGFHPPAPAGLAHGEGQRFQELLSTLF